MGATFTSKISLYEAPPSKLQATSNGLVSKHLLKIPHRDGTTHVVFDPKNSIAKLAALVPKPRVNMTRLHAVFAPNSKYRAMPLA
jgi:flagellar basal body rod protein FlgC